MIKFLRPAILLGILAFTQLAFAQSGLTGIAITQAPEAGGGMCYGEDAADTIACAQADCVTQTELEIKDCFVTNWCAPAGWTLDVFIQSKDGPHWHEFSCGWPTREQAELSAKIICQAEHILGCMPVVVWSPAGQRIELF